MHKNRILNGLAPITPQFSLDFVKLSTRKEIYKRLFEAKIFIDNNYIKIKSNKEIAQYCLISEYHFIRYYKLVFNITPHQYLIKKKLEKTIHLLKMNDTEINQIALKCGFPDLPTFSKAFKKHFKLSPSKYKEIFLNSSNRE